MEYTVNRFIVNRFASDTTRINLCESLRSLAAKTFPPQIKDAEQIQIQTEIPHRTKSFACNYYNRSRDTFSQKILHNDKKQWAQHKLVMTTDLKKQWVQRKLVITTDLKKQ